MTRESEFVTSLGHPVRTCVTHLYSCLLHVEANTGTESSPFHIRATSEDPSLAVLFCDETHIAATPLESCSPGISGTSLLRHDQSRAT